MLASAVQARFVPDVSSDMGWGNLSVWLSFIGAKFTITTQDGTQGVALTTPKGIVFAGPGALLAQHENGQVGVYSPVIAGKAEPSPAPHHIRPEPHAVTPVAPVEPKPTAPTTATAVTKAPVTATPVKATRGRA